MRGVSKVDVQLVRISRNRLRARINNTMYRLPKLLWLFRRKCLLIERTFACLIFVLSKFRKPLTFFQISFDLVQFNGLGIEGHSSAFDAAEYHLILTMAQEGV